MKLVLAGSVCITLGLGFSMGCSDPPAQPAQGAASIFLQPTGPNGGSCPSAAEVTVPASASPFISCNPSTGACTPTKKVAVDGDGPEVACSVSGGGDSYALSGSLTQGGFAFSFQTATPVSATGGTITVYARKAFGDLPLSDSTCQLTILAIGKGTIWGTYSCPAMTEGASGSLPPCTATGKFAFENCGS